MSERTLRRKLAAFGTTLSAELDAVRLEVALECLETKKMSVERTAAALGFSDSTALFRAFRRWTGTSPRRYLEGRGKSLSCS